MFSGEEKAWEALESLEPEGVERNALVRYDRERSCYLLDSLGTEFSVSPQEREIRGLSPEAEAVRKRLAYFLDLSLLCYLAAAKDIGLTGRLVRPESLKGGHHFFKGTHALPLNELAEKYGADREGFLRQAARFGARALDLGDASAELHPLPRVPVTLILWLGDVEFLPRADLLFDSSVELQVPLDISWSLAMLCVLVML